MKSSIAIIFLAFLPFGSFSQESTLDKYIQEGLENNLALKMKLDDYRQGLLSLQEAKGFFLPDIGLHARYSVAGGGRMIEFPVGDLFNPVYNTLNQLTLSNMFQEIENQEFAFYRPSEHETKIRLIQPILKPDIYFNKKIKENLAESARLDMESYKRKLISEIKTAYYNYLKYLQIQDILLRTEELVNENIRVNRSLYKNDKINMDVVFRSEAELSKLKQQQSEAEKAVINSSAYFNFLLNRDLMLPIETEKIDLITEIPYNERNDAVNNALLVREEIKMMSAYKEAAANNLKMKKSGYLPEVYAVMDYGFQGAKYGFSADDDFYLASLVLKWDLFKGFTKRTQINQAQINLEKILDQKAYTEKSIQLQVINAWANLAACEKKIPAAESELIASQETFRLVNRKYMQGQANLIEFMDARNTLTNAETNRVIANFEYLIAYAEFEGLTGL